MDPDEIYRHLGDLIRRRRKHLKLTQATLAGRLRISRGALANIETGRQRVLVHQLYSFAVELGLAPSDLVPALATSAEKPDAHKLPLPPGLSPREQDQVARIFGETRLEAAQPVRNIHGKQEKN